MTQIISKKVSLGLFVCVSLAALAAGSEVVGKLGTIELKSQELRKIINAESQEARSQLGVSIATLNQFVRGELVRRAVLAEARSKAWDKRPEVILQMERAREQALISAYANHIAWPPAEYPAEAEIQSFYESNKNQFTVPTRYRIAQIFVSIPDGADKNKLDAAKKRAQDIQQLAAAQNADFAALAKTYSEHAESASKGGEQGWFEENQIIPEVRAPLSKLQPGQVSAAIHSSQGWHILKLLEKQEPSVRPLKEVRQNVIATLKIQRARENEQKYVENLVAQSPITVDQEELAKLQSSLR